MKKRVISSLLAASMLMASLTGCGSSAGDGTAASAGVAESAETEADSANAEIASEDAKEVSKTGTEDLSGTTITFWHSMSGVNGEALTALEIGRAHV